MVIEGNIFTSRVNSMKISDVANRAVKLKGGNKFEGDITFTVSVVQIEAMDILCVCNLFFFPLIRIP